MDLAGTAESVDFPLAPLRQANFRIKAHPMRTMTVAIALMLSTASAFGQDAGTAAPGATPLPARTVTAPPAGAATPTHAAPAKPAAASTAESRSAAALALSHEPTLDE